MLESLTCLLSTDHTKIPTNLYSSQCLPPQTHAPDPHPPNKHFILSLLPLLLHLPYQNITSTTFTITSKPWLTNITLVWNIWMNTSMPCLQNLLIKVLRQTSNKNNSQIFHPKYQPMETALRNWTSSKHRSSPCHSILQNFFPNYQLMKTALTKIASPTSLTFKQKWKNMKRYSTQKLIQILITSIMNHLAP